jgi:hypothetical protein
MIGLVHTIKAWWWIRVLCHAKPPGYGTWFRLRVRRDKPSSARYVLLMSRLLSGDRASGLPSWGPRLCPCCEARTDQARPSDGVRRSC